jgi:haloacetate dehalogenase
MTFAATQSRRDPASTLTASCDRTRGGCGMFDGFEAFDLTTAGTSIHGRRGGSGPPVLLLHGIPETHLMWHRVAPHLAERYTVIATDLRGYGDSGTPPSTADHEPYSMRALGRDQLEVMRQLGYERFSIVGHDRGARCAYRLALDHPDAVVRLAVMDVVPVGDAYDRADKDFSLAYWQWSFLAAPEPVPEQFINAAPATLVEFMLDTWPEVNGAFPPALRAEYIDKFSHPETVHAICEEFRAAATGPTPAPCGGSAAQPTRPPAPAHGGRARDAAPTASQPGWTLSPARLPHQPRPALTSTARASRAHTASVDDAGTRPGRCGDAGAG